MNVTLAEFLENLQFPVGYLTIEGVCDKLLITHNNSLTDLCELDSYDEYKDCLVSSVLVSDLFEHPYLMIYLC